MNENMIFAYNLAEKTITVYDWGCGECVQSLVEIEQHERMTGEKLIRILEDDEVLEIQAYADEIMNHQSGTCSSTCEYCHEEDTDKLERILEDPIINAMIDFMNNELN